MKKILVILLLGPVLMPAAAQQASGSASLNVNPLVTAQFNPLLAAGIHVTIGEFGEFDCAHCFIDSVMNWADAYTPAISYFAWAWNTSQGCLDLISDYSAGTATHPYGAGFKAHLALIR